MSRGSGPLNNLRPRLFFIELSVSECKDCADGLFRNGLLPVSAHWFYIRRRLTFRYLREV